MYNNDSWWNYKNTKDKDLINEIKLQLIYNQFIKLENEVKHNLTQENNFRIVCTINLTKSIETKSIDILFNLQFSEELQDPPDELKDKSDYTFDKENFMELTFIEKNDINNINNILDNIEYIFRIPEKNYRDFHTISQKQIKQDDNHPPFENSNNFTSNDKIITYTTNNIQKKT
tara:strand:- start:236 stop:757 length:522 start_codon:yes stop_codon:yes gene_type:complete